MSERRDKNVTSVIDQLYAREQAGLNKYGTNTERTDLDTLEWLQHLQEELMDGAVYIERLKGDVKELLRLSTEPEGREEQPDWHPGHDAPHAFHEGDQYSPKTENTIMGSKEFDELPRFATDKEAGFTEENKYDFSEQKYSTPQHVKIPTDDE